MRLALLLLTALTAQAEGPHSNFCSLTETGAIETFDMTNGAASWNGGNKYIATVLGWYVDPSIPQEFYAPIEKVRQRILDYTYNVYLVPVTTPNEKCIRWHFVDQSQMVLGNSVLAESYLPNAGNGYAGLIKFNAGKDWRLKDVFSVALHEAGHAVFGLPHMLKTYDPNAPWFGVTPVMYPAYWVHYTWTPLDVEAMNRVVNTHAHAFKWIMP